MHAATARCDLDLADPTKLATCYSLFPNAPPARKIPPSRTWIASVARPVSGNGADCIFTQKYNDKVRITGVGSNRIVGHYPSVSLLDFLG